MSISSLSTQLYANVSTGADGGADLVTLALLLQIERYNVLGSQLRDEFEDMKKRNDWLKTANAALAELRVCRPNNDKEFHGYGSFKDAQGKPQGVFPWMVKNGIAIAGNGNGYQADFDAAISNLKARIDTVNSESQMSLIRLQSLMDKVNQSVELATNLLAKDSKVKENILGNIR
ncbi:hypothetical protein ILFOPFJJ_06883 [Ensifer psoraleae]|uniref:hypothetical protein n=1 Tax=Sinorhizobium psoraleae TaxID=520838 RepID=UPI001569C157|nr:hypothetical protein [Sinorhizobium psoraleae]NRP75959.1 hypothetical protein [Sinorhizobium psoraleae]